jgi:hypothetical protein
VGKYALMVKPTRASALKHACVVGSELRSGFQNRKFRLTGGSSNEISGDSETPHWAIVQPTSQQKEGLLGAIKRGEADLPTPSWEVAVSIS